MESEFSVVLNWIRDAVRKLIEYSIDIILFFVDLILGILVLIICCGITGLWRAQPVFRSHARCFKDRNWSCGISIPFITPKKKQQNIIILTTTAEGTEDGENENQQAHAIQVEQEYDNEEEIESDEWMFRVWAACQIFFSIVDLACFPLAGIMLISPFRWMPFLLTCALSWHQKRFFYRKGALYDESVHGEKDKGLVYNRGFLSAVLFGDVFVLAHAPAAESYEQEFAGSASWECDLCYRSSLRHMCLLGAGFAIQDAVSIPFVLANLFPLLPHAYKAWLSLGKLMYLRGWGLFWAVITSKVDGNKQETRRKNAQNGGHAATVEAQKRHQAKLIEFHDLFQSVENYCNKPLRSLSFRLLYHSISDIFVTIFALLFGGCYIFPFGYWVLRNFIGMRLAQPGYGWNPSWSRGHRAGSNTGDEPFSFEDSICFALPGVFYFDKGESEIETSGRDGRDGGGKRHHGPHSLLLSPIHYSVMCFHGHTDSIWKGTNLDGIVACKIGTVKSCLNIGIGQAGVKNSSGGVGKKNYTIIRRIGTHNADWESCLTHGTEKVEGKRDKFSASDQGVYYQGNSCAARHLIEGVFLELPKYDWDRFGELVFSVFGSILYDFLVVLPSALLTFGTIIRIIPYMREAFRVKSFRVVVSADIAEIEAGFKRAENERRAEKKKEKGVNRGGELQAAAPASPQQRRVMADAPDPGSLFWTLNRSLFPRRRVTNVVETKTKRFLTLQFSTVQGSYPPNWYLCEEDNLWLIPLCSVIGVGINQKEVEKSQAAAEAGKENRPNTLMGAQSINPLLLDIIADALLAEIRNQLQNNNGALNEATAIRLKGLLASNDDEVISIIEALRETSGMEGFGGLEMTIAILKEELLESLRLGRSKQWQRRLGCFIIVGHDPKSTVPDNIKRIKGESILSKQGANAFSEIYRSVPILGLTKPTIFQPLTDDDFSKVKKKSKLFFEEGCDNIFKPLLHDYWEACGGDAREMMGNNNNSGELKPLATAMSKGGTRGASKVEVYGSNKPSAKAKSTLALYFLRVAQGLNPSKSQKVDRWQTIKRDLTFDMYNLTGEASLGASVVTYHGKRVAEKTLTLYWVANSPALQQEQPGGRQLLYNANPTLRVAFYSEELGGDPLSEWGGDTQHLQHFGALESTGISNQRNRRLLWENALLVIIDLLMLPFCLVLVITWYRFPKSAAGSPYKLFFTDIRGFRVKNSSVLDNDAGDGSMSPALALKVTIIEQTFLVLLEAVLLIPVLCVWGTQYRWINVRPFSPNDTSFHSDIIAEFTLLVLDCVFWLPLLLFFMICTPQYMPVILSELRRENLRYHLQNRKLFKHNGIVIELLERARAGVSADQEFAKHVMLNAIRDEINRQVREKDRKEGKKPRRRRDGTPGEGDIAGGGDGSPAAGDDFLDEDSNDAFGLGPTIIANNTNRAGGPGNSNLRGGRNMLGGVFGQNRSDYMIENDIVGEDYEGDEIDDTPLWLNLRCEAALQDPDFEVADGGGGLRSILLWQILVFCIDIPFSCMFLCICIVPLRPSVPSTIIRDSWWIPLKEAVVFYRGSVERGGSTAGGEHASRPPPPDPRKQTLDCFVALIRDLFFTFPNLILLTVLLYRALPVWTTLYSKLFKALERYEDTNSKGPVGLVEQHKAKKDRRLKKFPIHSIQLKFPEDFGAQELSRGYRMDSSPLLVVNGGMKVEIIEKEDGTVRKLSSAGLAAIDSPLNLDEISTIQVRILGEQFWELLVEIFGFTIVSLGRGFLPYVISTESDLKAGQIPLTLPFKKLKRSTLKTKIVPMLLRAGMRGAVDTQAGLQMIQANLDQPGGSPESVSYGRQLVISDKILLQFEARPPDQPNTRPVDASGKQTPNGGAGNGKWRDGSKGTFLLSRIILSYEQLAQLFSGDIVEIDEHMVDDGEYQIGMETNEKDFSSSGGGGNSPGGSKEVMRLVNGNNGNAGGNSPVGRRNSLGGNIDNSNIMQGMDLGQAPKTSDRAVMNHIMTAFYLESNAFGVLESTWNVVLLELIEVLKDVYYFLIFLRLILNPVRWFALLKTLFFESLSTWALKESRSVADLTLVHLEHTVLAVLSQLEPKLNQELKYWCRDLKRSGVQNVAANYMPVEMPNNMINREDIIESEYIPLVLTLLRRLRRIQRFTVDSEEQERFKSSEENEAEADAITVAAIGMQSVAPSQMTGSRPAGTVSQGANISRPVGVNQSKITNATTGGIGVQNTIGPQTTIGIDGSGAGGAGTGAVGVNVEAWDPESDENFGLGFRLDFDPETEKPADIVEFHKQFSLRLLHFLGLQDGRLRLSFMTSEIHRSLVENRISPEQHGLLLQECLQIAGTLAQMQIKEGESIKKMVRVSGTVAGETYTMVNGKKVKKKKPNTEKWGIRNKPTKFIRFLIADAASEADRQALGIFLLLCLLLSVYRLPSCLQELFRRKSWDPNRSAFTFIVQRQLRFFIYEVASTFEILFYILLLMLTVIKFLDAMTELIYRGGLTSLESAKIVLRGNLEETLETYVELFNMLFFLKTYRRLAKVFLYALFVPPACLSEMWRVLIGACVSSVQARFLLNIGIFYYIVIGLSPNGPMSDGGTMSADLYFWAALASMCAASVVIMPSNARLFPERDDPTILKPRVRSIRVSWPNVLRVLTVGFEVVFWHVLLNSSVRNFEVDGGKEIDQLDGAGEVSGKKWTGPVSFDKGTTIYYRDSYTSGGSVNSYVSTTTLNGETTTTGDATKANTEAIFTSDYSYMAFLGCIAWITLAGLLFIEKQDLLVHPVFRFCHYFFGSCIPMFSLPMIAILMMNSRLSVTTANTTLPTEDRATEENKTAGLASTNLGNINQLISGDFVGSSLLCAMFIVTNFFLGEESSEFLQASHEGEEVQNIISLDLHWTTMYSFGYKMLQVFGVFLVASMKKCCCLGADVTYTPESAATASEGFSANQIGLQYTKGTCSIFGYKSTIDITNASSTIDMSQKLDSHVAQCVQGNERMVVVGTAVCGLLWTLGYSIVYPAPKVLRAVQNTVNNLGLYIMRVMTLFFIIFNSMMLTGSETGDSTADNLSTMFGTSLNLIWFEMILLVVVFIFVNVLEKRGRFAKVSRDDQLTEDDLIKIQVARGIFCFPRAALLQNGKLFHMYLQQSHKKLYKCFDVANHSKKTSSRELVVNLDTGEGSTDGCAVALYKIHNIMESRDLADLLVMLERHVKGETLSQEFLTLRNFWLRAVSVSAEAVIYNQSDEEDEAETIIERMTGRARQIHAHSNVLNATNELRQLNRTLQALSRTQKARTIGVQTNREKKRYEEDRRKYLEIQRQNLEFQKQKRAQEEEQAALMRENNKLEGELVLGQGTLGQGTILDAEGNEIDPTTSQGIVRKKESIQNQGNNASFVNKQASIKSGILHDPSKGQLQSINSVFAPQYSRAAGNNNSDINNPNMLMPAQSVMSIGPKQSTVRGKGTGGNNNMLAVKGSVAAKGSNANEMRSMVSAATSVDTRGFTTKSSTSQKMARRLNELLLSLRDPSYTGHLTWMMVTKLNNSNEDVARQIVEEYLIDFPGLQAEARDFLFRFPFPSFTPKFTFSEELIAVYNGRRDRAKAVEGGGSSCAGCCSAKYCFCFPSKSTLSGNSQDLGFDVYALEARESVQSFHERYREVIAWVHGERDINKLRHLVNAPQNPVSVGNKVIPVVEGMGNIGVTDDNLGETAMGFGDIIPVLAKIDYRGRCVPSDASSSGAGGMLAGAAGGLGGYVTGAAAVVGARNLERAPEVEWGTGMNKLGLPNTDMGFWAADLIGDGDSSIRKAGGGRVDKKISGSSRGKSTLAKAVDPKRGRDTVNGVLNLDEGPLQLDKLLKSLEEGGVGRYNLDSAAEEEVEKGSKKSKDKKRKKDGEKKEKSGSISSSSSAYESSGEESYSSEESQPIEKIKLGIGTGTGGSKSAPSSPTAANKIKAINRIPSYIHHNSGDLDWLIEQKCNTVSEIRCCMGEDALCLLIQHRWEMGKACLDGKFDDKVEADEDKREAVGMYAVGGNLVVGNQSNTGAAAEAGNSGGGSTLGGGNTSTIQLYGSSNMAPARIEREKKNFQSFECSTCTEDIDDPHNCITLQPCGCKFCMNCWRTCVRVANEQNKIVNLKCPGCKSSVRRRFVLEGYPEFPNLEAITVGFKIDKQGNLVKDTKALQKAVGKEGSKKDTAAGGADFGAVDEDERAKLEAAAAGEKANAAENAGGTAEAVEGTKKPEPAPITPTNNNNPQEGENVQAGNPEKGENAAVTNAAESMEQEAARKELEDVAKKIEEAEIVIRSLDPALRNPLEHYTKRVIYDFVSRQNLDYCFCPGVDCPNVFEKHGRLDLDFNGSHGQQGVKATLSAASVGAGGGGGMGTFQRAGGCIAVSSTTRHALLTIKCPTCTTEFCPKCMVSPSHVPFSDCKKVKHWCEELIGIDAASQAKNLDRMNNEWIKSNSKQCPSCNQSICKDQGCMHMRCSCGYEFCWICMKNWKTHRNCNRLEEPTRQPASADDPESDEFDTQLFQFYRERYFAHQYASMLAVKGTENLTQLARVLSELYKPAINVFDVEFLKYAGKIVEQGRNVLKWTFVQSYYNAVEERNKQRELAREKANAAAAAVKGGMMGGKKGKSKKDAFQKATPLSLYHYHQDQIETLLERLTAVLESFIYHALAADLPTKLVARLERQKKRREKGGGVLLDTGMTHANNHILRTDEQDAAVHRALLTIADEQQRRADEAANGGAVIVHQPVVEKVKTVESFTGELGVKQTIEGEVFVNALTTTSTYTAFQGAASLVSFDAREFVSTFAAFREHVLTLTTCVSKLIGALTMECHADAE